MYPQWKLSADSPFWWIAVVVWPFVLALLFRLRRWLGSLPLWGIAHFYVCLIPVLGFVSFNYLIYSFVADHFLYLAVIGGALTVALLAERVAWIEPATPNRRVAVTVIAVLVLVGCTLQTHQETKHWRNNEAFWLHAYSRNPNDFGPTWNLGLHYKRLGLWAEALPFFERATHTWPGSDFAFRRYAQAISKVNGPQAAVEACEAKLAQQPRFYAAYLERGINNEKLRRPDQALRDYRRVTRMMRKNSGPWQEASRRIQRLQKGRRQP
jgi:hypothetical protein